MNGEVLGIYVLAAGSKCLVFTADWFLKLFFFSLFFCSIGFQIAGNLNDIPLMWCLFSSKYVARVI